MHPTHWKRTAYNPSNLYRRIPARDTMQPTQSGGYAADLVRYLCSNPHETEWLEFKENNARPGKVGETVSALANGVALLDHSVAYIVWGISDVNHVVVGSEFRPGAVRVGNEEFKPWLNRSLNPTTGLRFHEAVIEGKAVVVLEVERASHRPVAFKGTEYVRIGSKNGKLNDFPEEERRLWESFNRSSFEEEIALGGLTSDDLWSLLDVEAYFDLLETARPTNVDSIIEYLEHDRIIKRGQTGRWSITNAGVILFAKDLERFSDLRRKRVRIIEYENSSRLHARRELEFNRGYASAFYDMVEIIMVILPAKEIIEGGLRRSVPMIPKVAVRELMANMLVHQNFRISGAGPMVEIFERRIEFTNPGAPLVDTRRLIDMPPVTRNDVLASLMRRFGICEERGSGIDKVVDAVEGYQLPAPRFERPGEFTKATLYGPRKWSNMTSDDRLWACYLHASHRYQVDLPVNNKSVRERFGLDSQHSSQVSRLLGDAVKVGLLCVRDSNAGYRTRTYLPWWAANPNGIGDTLC